MKFVYGIGLLLGLLFVTGDPGNGLNGLVMAAVRVGVFIGILYGAYMAYDSFRSAWLGINPRTSEAVNNPGTFSNRAAGFFLSIFWGGCVLVLLSMLVFRWGLWAPYHGG